MHELFLSFRVLKSVGQREEVLISGPVGGHKQLSLVQMQKDCFSYCYLVCLVGVFTRKGLGRDYAYTWQAGSILTMSQECPSLVILSSHLWARKDEAPQGVRITLLL